MLDRGNKKWTSLMTPELVDGLKQIEEDEKNVEKPILSEDQYEDIQLTLNEALEYNLAITIEYYKNKRIHTATGRIKLKNGRMEVVTNNDIVSVNINDVVGASLS